MPRLAPPSPAAAVVAPGAAAGRAGRAVRRRGARAAVGRGAPRAAAVGAARGRNPEGVGPDTLGTRRKNCCAGTGTCRSGKRKRCCLPEAMLFELLRVPGLCGTARSFNPAASPAAASLWRSNGRPCGEKELVREASALATSRLFSQGALC